MRQEIRQSSEVHTVAEKLSKKRICKWTQSERSFIEQVLRYGAEKEKTVYQETNELVNKLCMDEYWLREDGYFTGLWYASEEKRNEAAEMLAREITITGGYDLLHAGKQEEKEKRIHAEKMQLIQVLANAFRTGTLDEKTLSELEIVYTKAGKDFSGENMTLTSEGMKLLVENEKNILLQKSGFKLELGWGEVIDGLLLLEMGAAIRYAQSSESLAYQGGSNSVDLSKYTELSTSEVKDILKARGLDDKIINDLISSFDGPIYKRTGFEGEIFTITESKVGDASGVFVTRGSAGSTPAERIDNMALPPNNSALVESQVELAREQILFEGKVAGQPDWALIANDGIPRKGSAWQVITDGGKYNNAIRRR